MNHNRSRHETVIGWSFHAVGLASVLLAAWAFYACVYSPLIQKRERCAARIDQIDALLGKSAGVQQQHRKLRREVQQLEQVVASMRGRFPDELREHEFEGEARGIAEAVGLEDVGFQPQSAEEASTHHQAELRFHGRGSFESICRFLAEIDQLARITKISNVDIRSDADNLSNSLQGSFVLYYGVTSHDTDRKGEAL